jgi:recombination protein RecR
MSENIQYCEECHNISDKPVCEICSDPKRDQSTICVVESIKEVMLIENTAQYHGVYHVLGGVISPMNGISPNDLEIASLVERVEQGNIKEVILALSPNMEGDTTCFYIYRKLAHLPVAVTTIARGVAIGDDLEYADEITLGRSILNRITYNKS